METILFVIFSVAAVVGGFLTITRRNPLASALSLVITLLSVAGLYALLHAPLLAVMQVIVYAGAIMVLIIFVIMLLNQPDEEHQKEEIGRGRVAIAVILGGMLLYVFYRAFGSLDLPLSGKAPDDFGSVKAVGEVLFTKYLYPFEIVSVLLLVAIVGATILAKKHLD